MIQRKVENVPEYKVVQIGTKEEITYLTSDGKEWKKENQAIKHEEYLTKFNEYKAIPLVSTREDDWYYLKDRITLDKVLDHIGVFPYECTLDNDWDLKVDDIHYPVWIRFEYVDGGDYRPRAYLTTLDYYKDTYNELMEKIKDVPI